MVLCSEPEKCQSVETPGLVMFGNSDGEIVGMELALEKAVLKLLYASFSKTKLYLTSNVKKKKIIFCSTVKLTATYFFLKKISELESNCGSQYLPSNPAKSFYCQ